MNGDRIAMSQRERDRLTVTAMYVDRDSIFRAENKHPNDPRGAMTQFPRALGQLEIELILAVPEHRAGSSGSSIPPGTGSFCGQRRPSLGEVPHQTPT